jgi:acetyltransferase-like isoleucine patch superfamily enzyme
MAPSVVHPLALCESEDVGDGTRVWAFAHVMKGARLGRNCNICDHAFVETGAVLGDNVTVKNGVAIWDGVTAGDDVFIGPNAVFTNDMMPRAAIKKPVDEWLVRTTLGNGATVGANSTIVCGVTVGEGAFVGAGTVVVRDVPSYAMVVGNPARQIGWACRCGVRLGATLVCDACGTVYAQADAGLVPED